MNFAIKHSLILAVIFLLVGGSLALIAPDLFAHEEAPRVVKTVLEVCFVGWVLARKLN